jgi:hypothetical protein
LREPAQRRIVLISIRLGKDTLEARPEGCDSDDDVLASGRGARDGPGGKDFFDDGNEQRFEVLALQLVDAAYTWRAGSSATMTTRTTSMAEDRLSGAAPE